MRKTALRVTSTSNDAAQNLVDFFGTVLYLVLGDSRVFELHALVHCSDP